MSAPKSSVIRAKAGIQVVGKARRAVVRRGKEKLDSRLRGNDG